MLIYKLLIEQRDYSQWYFIDSITGNRVYDNEILDSINPYEKRLFSQDYISYKESQVKLEKSIVRNGTVIAGVLVLSNNKTYGKIGKRHLYQCIPDDKRLPVFLVPYEIKMGFSKDFKNKYVTFNFCEWNGKHPIGKLLSTIGTVDEIYNFFEYQLYCKCLQISINDFTKQVKRVMNKTSYDDIINEITTTYNLKDHTNKRIITIDSECTTEYDDALFFQEDEQYTRVYVYIANVVLWLEVMQLWESLSNRVSTIYLPDRRRPMLPTILADTLCSLQQGEIRIAVTYEYIYDKSNNLIDVECYNTKIKVNKNHVYESLELRNYSMYTKLLNFTKENNLSIENSHDVVAYWMIKINQYTSEIFLNKKLGIFRSVAIIDKHKSIQNTELSKDATRAITNWNNITGQYIYYDDNGYLKHDLLDEKSYVHISSPIRRLVDLLNQIEWMEIIGCNMSLNSKSFHNKWIENIDYLNTSMRAIRKVQQECDILHRCNENPELLDQKYNGILFDKIKKTDGSYSYIVYLEELKMLCKFVDSEEYENYQHYSFRLFMFEKESSFKKKIKLSKI